jgi:Ssp1 endopeptidase immunity protein Rap1a
MLRFGVAILLALTMPASATDRADKILSGCKIMFGILAENKAPPAGTAMGGGDATFCLGIVQAFVNVCRPTGVPFQSLDMVTLNQMLRVVILYIEARPERQHEDFAPLAGEALEAVWPCKR